jgi:hypothetical protein
MSQSNLKKQSNALTVVPEVGYLAIFYSDDLGTWAYKDENNVVYPFIQDNPLIVSETNASLIITNQDFVRVFGNVAVTLTLPDATLATKAVTIKQTSTQDVTITGILAQTIDDVLTQQLKANKKTSVTLVAQGGKWWLTG